MPGYRLTIAKLKSVCKLVRSKGTQDKLIQRCFASAVGRQFVGDIRAFHGHVHLGRWGTVAFAIPQVLNIKPALCYGWSLRQFRQGSNERPDDESAASDDQADLPEIRGKVGLKL